MAASSDNNCWNATSLRACILQIHLPDWPHGGGWNFVFFAMQDHMQCFFFWYPWTSMAPNTMNKVFLFCCCCYYPPSFASGHSCGACYPRTRFMSMACLRVPLWAISKHTCLVNYVEVSLGCYDLWEGLLYYVWIDDERNLDWDEIADKFENCDLRKHYRRGRVKMRDVYVERFYELEISCGALRINYQF